MCSDVAGSRRGDVVRQVAHRIGVSLAIIDGSRQWVELGEPACIRLVVPRPHLVHPRRPVQVRAGVAERIVPPTAGAAYLLTPRVVGTICPNLRREWT